MPNNKKIARWAGFDTHTCDPYSFHCDDCASGISQTPDYENSDAAAVSLLNVLAEKGYHPQVAWSNFHSMWEVHYHHTNFMDDCHGRDKSLGKAITSAILQLIESEASK